MITATEMAGRSKENYEQDLQPIYLITQIHGNNRAIESCLLEDLLNDGAVRSQELNAAIQERIRENDELIAELKTIDFSSDEISTNINEYLALLPDYRVQRDTIVRLGHENLNKEGYQIFSSGAFNESRNLMVSLLEDTQVLLAEYAEQEHRVTMDNARYSMIISSILVLAACLFSIGICVWITRFISKPLRELQLLMKRAEDGDLTVVARYQADDEVGQISHSFNAMLNSLRQMMQSVADSTEKLTASSQEMSESTDQAERAFQIITDNTAVISAGVEVHSGYIERTSQSFLTMEEKAEHARNRGNELSLLISKTAAVAGRGVETAGHLIRKVRELGFSAAVNREIIVDIDKMSEEIHHILDESDALIQSAVRQTEEIRKSIGHVSREGQAGAQVMKQAADISRKGTEVIRGTHSASEEQLTALGEMALSAQYLASLAEELQRNLAHFKL